MKLKQLEDAKIISQLKSLVSEEREVLSKILLHLIEMHERKLYLSEGYPSLYAYCVEILGYNEAQAYRRISAMQLLRELPELKNNIETGSLNLTQLTQAKKYFKVEAENSKPLSKNEKIDLLTSLENKSTRETEKIFVRLNPLAIPADKTRVIRENLTEIRFVANDCLLEKLNRFKELDSHVQHHPSYADLIERLVDLALNTKEKALQPRGKRSRHEKEQVVRNAKELNAKELNAKELNTQELTLPEEKNNIAHKNVKSFAAPKKSCVKISVAKSEKSKMISEKATERSRAIPIFVKRIVINRDGQSCNYIHPLTGKRCGSKYRLQFEHIQPFAKNGTHSQDNITILCQSHNLFAAEKQFGQRKMNSFRSSLH